MVDVLEGGTNVLLINFLQAHPTPPILRLVLLDSLRVGTLPVVSSSLRRHLLQTFLPVFLLSMKIN